MRGNIPEAGAANDKNLRRLWAKGSDIMGSPLSLVSKTTSRRLSRLIPSNPNSNYLVFSNRRIYTTFAPARTNGADIALEKESLMAVDSLIGYGTIFAFG
jgi:hypothetical protein